MAELNPNSEGGIPGGTKSTGCKSGVVLSVSAKGGVGLGPLFNLGLQAGAYNNLASNVQSGFVEPESNIINLESEVVLANEAVGAYISPIGAQITFYRGRAFETQVQAQHADPCHSLLRCHSVRRHSFVG